MPDLGEGVPFKFIEIFFEQTQAYNVLTTDTLANPHVFAKWEVQRGGASPSQRLSLFYMQLNALMHRTAGAGTVTWGFHTSPDGIVWSTFLKSDFFATPEAEKQVDIADTNVSTATNFIGILAYQTDGATTTGTVRRFGFNGLWYLPLDYSFKRLI